MDAILRASNDDTEQFVATSRILPGTIFQTDSGRAAIVDGLEAIEIGQTGTARCVGVVETVTAGDLDLDDGASVGWDESAGIPLAAADEDSDYMIGKARRGGVETGQTALFVALNA